MVYKIGDELETTVAGIGTDLYCGVPYAVVDGERIYINTEEREVTLEKQSV